MRKFKVAKNYYDTAKDLFLESAVQFQPGVTVLIGCNGCGKTTLLKQIQRQLEELGLPYIEYKNVNDGGSRAVQSALDHGMGKLMASLMMSSEGESLSQNIGQMVQKLGAMTKNCPDDKEFWVLLDGSDSGMSIDHIIEIKEFFHSKMIEGDKERHFYILITANDYEMASGERCLDVRTCEYREFKTYEEYKEFILESRKHKDERYGYEE